MRLALTQANCSHPATIMLTSYIFHEFDLNYTLVAARAAHFKFERLHTGDFAFTNLRSLDSINLCVACLSLASSTHPPLPDVLGSNYWTTRVDKDWTRQCCQIGLDWQKLAQISIPTFDCVG